MIVVKLDSDSHILHIIYQIIFMSFRNCESFNDFFRLFKLIFIKCYIWCRHIFREINYFNVTISFRLINCIINNLIVSYIKFITIFPNLYFRLILKIYFRAAFHPILQKADSFRNHFLADKNFKLIPEIINWFVYLICRPLWFQQYCCPFYVWHCVVFSPK